MEDQAKVRTPTEFEEETKQSEESKTNKFENPSKRQKVDDHKEEEEEVTKNQQQQQQEEELEQEKKSTTEQQDIIDLQDDNEGVDDDMDNQKDDKTDSKVESPEISSLNKNKDPQKVAGINSTNEKKVADVTEIKEKRSSRSKVKVIENDEDEVDREEDEEEDEEEEEEYEVEAIRKKRHFVSQKTSKSIDQYFIKWETYPEKDNTWEPKENLPEEMIKEFEERYKNKRWPVVVEVIEKGKGKKEIIRLIDAELV
jgi:hypothetical protein